MYEMGAQLTAKNNTLIGIFSQIMAEFLNPFYQ